MRVEAFSFSGVYGEVSRRYRPRDLESEVRRLSDPANARETLHWGRNYLYALDLETEAGPVPVVVKQFRNEGLRARLRRRRRGSRATTSWRAALALSAAGIRTAEPVMLIESSEREGPSFYVSRRLTDFVESRYLFRAMRQGRREELFPGIDETAVFAAMGRLLRDVHAAGVWHRDVSMGNLLVSFADGDRRRPSVDLVDLNRARLGVRLTLLRRIRDLSRLPIREPEHRETFLRSYWGDEGAGFAAKRLLHRLAMWTFLTRNRVKAAIRRPFGAGALRPRRAYPHIPDAPVDASAREKAVWDPLSDQPHQHAGRLEKTREYVRDTRIHLEALRESLPAAVRTMRRYRELRRCLYARPHRWEGVGVGLRPWPEQPEAPLAAVEELGVDKVLLRLHPWQADHRAEEELAAELQRRGCEITYALPQNRELVRDLDRWRRSVGTLADTFLPYGKRFQIGQAVNRSKWGVWNYREYLELAAVAIEVLRSRGEVELAGPAVIDFEFYATLALVNMRQAAPRLDALASLLYVDRRGAPESRQLGFDTERKAVLMKAIADTARNCAGRSWITEFNWPLWEGPHSPAGRAVAVGEEAQADYLVRYYLLALATGTVERAFWWQVIAKGYGLVDPEGLRRRPAFHALAHLARVLAGATFQRPLEAPGSARLYLFTTATGTDLVVGWTVGEPARGRLPRPPRRVTGRDGEPLPAPVTEEVELSPSPRYFVLD